MKTAISLFTTLFLLASVSFGADFPKGSPKFQTDYDAAMKIAKAQKKPLLVVFSAAWCPPCQANKKEVYPSAPVKAYHDDFVWVYLDTDQKKNAAVAQKFSVAGIPHIQFVSSTGESLDKAIGGTTPKAFATKLRKVLKKTK